MTVVLIVEDDPDLRNAISDTLSMESFQVVVAESAEAALEPLATQHIDMIVSDVNMGGMSGYDLLLQVKKNYPMIPVLLITAYGTIEQSVNAMRCGAADYLVKPFRPQILVELVKHYASNLSAYGDDEPVAEEEDSRLILQMARKVAATDSTVLISGESGTGKEVLARYIHQHSPRAEKPFLAINCAAIPESMLEATLFGHEKGAFTGAYHSMPGKFEQADGGTLLLDEISEMESGLQAKLLRVLQEKEVERIGGKKVIALNVRIIATTNRQLHEEVINGRFREDLYYRLNVFPMQWKPLCERPKDILPLANKLLNTYAEKMHHPGARFDQSAIRLMNAYAWPGNIRELDNAIQRALIIVDTQLIKAEHFQLNNCALGQSREVFDNNPLIDGDDEKMLGEDLREREFEIILNVLKEENGSRKQAAERLGISARTLRYKLAKMREHGINLQAAVG